jgi:hypothetical protein
MRLAQEKQVPLAEALRAVKGFRGLVGSYNYQDEMSLGLGRASLLCIKDGAITPVE